MAKASGHQWKAWREQGRAEEAGAPQPFAECSAPGLALGVRWFRY